MSLVVFLGPSLPRSKAVEILPDAIFLPPAAQSDFLSAVHTHKPRAIGLIDGLFERVPSVWHKEILYALDRGIRVYGSSSMGALRAAETADFGTIGVGEIFRMYADGGLLDDDEVALSHAGEEFGFRPLSEPMVHVRATLALALSEGVVEQALHDRLIEVAKGQHFSQRTFPGILEAAHLSEDRLASLREFIRTRYVDLKGRDAEELLRAMGDLSDQPWTRPDFDFQPSLFFLRQSRREREVTRSAGKIGLEEIVSYFALHGNDFEEVSYAAQNALMTSLMAELLGVEPSAEEIAQEERRFRLRRRIKEADLQKWATDNDLDEAALHDFFRQRAACRAMHQRLSMGGYRSSRKMSALLQEMKANGQFPVWADRAAHQEAVLKRELPEFPTSEDDVEEMGPLVLEHLRQTPCRMSVGFEDWAKEAGFASLNQFKLDLLKARAARRRFWS